MKDKYFKVNLHNDELKQFNVVCYHPMLSSSLRDMILDRPIFERCDDDLCIINCGLTYDNKEEISKEIASIMINSITETKERFNAYEKYLDTIEAESVIEYNSAINLRNSRKK